MKKGGEGSEVTKASLGNIWNLGACEAADTSSAPKSPYSLNAIVHSPPKPHNPNSCPKLPDMVHRKRKSLSNNQKKLDRLLFIIKLNISGYWRFFAILALGDLHMRSRKVRIVIMDLVISVIDSCIAYQFNHFSYVMCHCYQSKLYAYFA